MVRVVAVRTDVRQPFARDSVRRVPPIVGRQAGNVRIQRRELVHQLPGTLHEDLVPLPIGRRLQICTLDEQALVVDPADDVGRFGRVAKYGRAPAQLTLDPGGHWRGESEVASFEPEMAPERLEQRSWYARGDDDTGGADSSVGGVDLGRLAVEGNLRRGGLLEDLCATLRRRSRQSQRGAVRVCRGP